MTATGRKLRRMSDRVPGAIGVSSVAAARAGKAAAAKVGGTLGAKDRRNGRQTRAIRLRARDTIRATATGTTIRLQGVPVGPWVWVNTGTAAHTIGPKGGKRQRAVRTVAGEGLAHPVRGVRHPGAAGRGRWRRAVDAATPAMVDALAARWYRELGV